MKIKSRISLIVFSAVCSLFSTHVTPALFAQNSPVTAKQVTHLLEEHYRNLKTLRASFLERYNEGPKQMRIESGTSYFRRPGQMRWEYESPEKKLFITDGKIVWFYVPYDRTVTKAIAKQSSDWRTPLALLTGKVELSRLCSTIDLKDERGLPPGHSVLRCLPRTGKHEGKASSPNSGADPLAGDDFTEVLLEVDTGSGELARIEIRQPGGVDLEYRFGSWQSDLPLSEEMFHFQIPAGVAIVDGASLAASPE